MFNIKFGSSFVLICKIWGTKKGWFWKTTPR